MIFIDVMRTDKKGVYFDCSCDYIVVCGSLDRSLTSRFCNAYWETFGRFINLWTSILCEKGELSM